MLKYIYKLMNIKHKIFVDVFGGSGVVMLNSPYRIKRVYNDINEDIVNLYRVLLNEDKRAKFLEILKYLPETGRGIWNFSKQNYKNKEFDDVARAVMTLKLFSISFSGVGNSWCFTVGNRHFSPKKYNLLTSKVFWHKLRNIVIECLDFEKLIYNWDSEQTLFYCDPPYIMETRRSRKAYYKHEFSTEDHERLVNLLSKIKGKCILSGYENNLYNNLGWNKETIEVIVYSKGITKNNQEVRPKGREVLWYNYELEPTLL